MSILLVTQKHCLMAIIENLQSLWHIGIYSPYVFYIIFSLILSKTCSWICLNISEVFPRYIQSEGFPFYGKLVLPFPTKEDKPSLAFPAGQGNQVSSLNIQLTMLHSFSYNTAQISPDFCYDRTIQNL